METKNLGTTSTGIQANVAGLLSYLLGWITGIIFFLIEKENKFVRFHALQSIVVFGALTVVQILVGMLISMVALMHLGFLIPLLSTVNLLLSLAGLIAWIVLMVKAFQGELFKIPLAADIAEKNS